MNNNVESVDLEEELYEHFKFEVPRATPLRIDKYLMGLIQMQLTKFKLLLLKEYFVNDATVKSNYKVKAFDVVRVRDADASSFENHIVPENIPWTLFMKMTPCC
jgi:23S rRNA pseudouridine1911/1915/1917 synthase